MRSLSAAAACHLRPACLLPSAVPRPWVEERQRRIGEPLSMTNTPKRPTRHHLWCSDRADMCLHPAAGPRIEPVHTRQASSIGLRPQLRVAVSSRASNALTTSASRMRQPLQCSDRADRRPSHLCVVVTSPCLTMRNRHLTQGRRQNHLGSTRPSRLSSGTTEPASISSVCGRALSRTDRSP
jgi:hypothetical protein